MHKRFKCVIFVTMRKCEFNFNKTNQDKWLVKRGLFMVDQINEFERVYLQTN